MLLMMTVFGLSSDQKLTIKRFASTWIRTYTTPWKWSDHLANLSLLVVVEWDVFSLCYEALTIINADLSEHLKLPMFAEKTEVFTLKSCAVRIVWGDSLRASLEKWANIPVLQRWICTGWSQSRLEPASTARTLPPSGHVCGNSSRYTPPPGACHPSSPWHTNIRKLLQLLLSAR